MKCCWFLEKVLHVLKLRDATLNSLSCPVRLIYNNFINHGRGEGGYEDDELKP